MLVETTHVTEVECYFACTRKGVHLRFVTSNGQNDICSFRAVKVFLTWSFKLINFKHLYGAVINDDELWWWYFTTITKCLFHAQLRVKNRNLGVSTPCSNVKPPLNGAVLLNVFCSNKMAIIVLLATRLTCLLVNFVFWNHRKTDVLFRTLYATASTESAYRQ